MTSLSRSDRDRVRAALNLSQETDEEEPHVCHADEAEDAWSRPTIHVYVADDEEALPDVKEEPAIESTLADALTEEEPETCEPLVSPTQRGRPVWVLLSLVAILGLVGGIGWQVIGWLQPASAIITIVGAQTHITISRTLTVVTSAPQATQVAGRLLSSPMITQAQSVPTTGVEHQPAEVARGGITFYNALPVQQTVTAGTLLTGSDGVQVVTEQDAVIPAGSFAANGQVSVPAHAVLTGPSGNIAARDLAGPCCRQGVLAQNTSAFGGGQDARVFPIVSAGDVESTASTLKTGMEPRAQAALIAQVHPEETLATNACTAQVKTDHAVGTEAAQVQVSVQETCTGEVYTMQAVQRLMEQAIEQEAMQHVGASVVLSGVSVQVTHTSVMEQQQGTLHVEVTGRGSALVPFSARRLQEIATQIAGRTQPEALRWLRQIIGVRSASIRMQGRNTSMLPSDPERIEVLVIYAVE